MAEAAGLPYSTARRAFDEHEVEVVSVALGMATELGTDTGRTTDQCLMIV